MSIALSLKIDDRIVIGTKPPAPLPLPATWQLTRPLWLNVEQDENGLFVISDDVFVMFGTGNTEEGALLHPSHLTPTSVAHIVVALFACQICQRWSWAVPS